MGVSVAGILGLDDRDVGAGIAAHDLGVVGLARDGDLVRAAAFYDVVVRDDVAVGGEHDAASPARTSSACRLQIRCRPQTVHAARIGLVRVHIDGGHEEAPSRDSLASVWSDSASVALMPEFCEPSCVADEEDPESLPPAVACQMPKPPKPMAQATAAPQKASRNVRPPWRLLLDGHSSCRMLRVLRLLIVLLLLPIIRLLPHGGGMRGMLVALRRRHGAVAGGAAMRIGHVLHAPSIRAGL